MSIKLGSISVDLIANTVSFSDGMNKMSQLSVTTGRNIQRSLNLIGASAAAMAGSIVAGLTASIDKAEDFAFTISKMAQQTGTTSEMFSKIAYSAKLAGVPLDTVKGAMERLAKTSYAAQNGQKASIDAYKALGISVKELQGPLQDSGALLVAVSKSLDQFSESTAKTGLEQKILGRSGSELAPLLKQMATGFDTASQQATLFGVVIGDRAAAQAKKLHDSLEEVESVALGVSLKLLSGVSPALDDIADKVLNFVTSAQGMKLISEIAKDITTVVRGVEMAFDFLTEHAKAIKRVFEGLALLQLGKILLPLIRGALDTGNGLDKVGFAALKMVGNLSGVSSVLPILRSVTKEIKLQTFMVTGLIREEGWLAGATYGVSGAFNSLKGALLSNPITLLAGVLAGVTYWFYEIAKAAMASEVDGGKWSDVWDAAALAVKEDLEDVAKTLALLSGDFAKFSALKYKWTPFEGLVKQAGEARRDSSYEGWMKDHTDPLLPGWQNFSKYSNAKKDAPDLPSEQKDKIDHLKLKLDELAAAAQAAHQSLLNAGKGVDFQRADEIAKEYTKTIIELEAVLKAQHKTLSEGDKAAIKQSITTRINDLSQAKYRDELQKSTDFLLSQASAQDILNQAMGRGAAATREAAIAAHAAKRDANQSEEWKQKNAVMRSVDNVAFGMEYDANNGGSDKTALAGVQAQINAQLLLNGAIVQGKRAREDAALASEQEAIRRQFADKGDVNESALNAELAANEKLFRLKQAEADLTRAVAMSPEFTFAEQARSLEDAAKAAHDAGIAISDMEMRATRKANWDAYLTAIDKTTLAVGDASEGVSVFFQQMARDSVSAAQQMHDILASTFESLNSVLERFLTGQKTSFAEFFRGISGQLAKIGIQKAEQGIAGAVLGTAGKADPTVSAITKSNEYLSQILSALTTKIDAGTAGTVSNGGLVATGIAGASTGASALAGALSPFLSMIPGMGGFGGHLALGGDVTAGMSYDVGEMGRERFTPNQSGTITPSKHLGTTINMPIDARGSTNPAETEMAIHRAMGQYAPHLASGTTRAMNEKRMRTPMSSR